MKGGATFLAVAILAAAAIPPVQAVAQELGPNAPFARLHADVAYYTNVAASSASLAAQRGLFREDISYTPSVDLNYNKQLGLTSFFLTGQAGYDFFQRNTILNRERLQGMGGFGGRFFGCDTMFRSSYARYQSDLQDLNVVATKNTTQDVSLALNGTCNTTGNLVPGFSVTQNWSTNSALLLQQSDYRSIATQGSIMYRNSLLGEISLFGQYNAAQFPKRFVSAPGGTILDGYKVYAGGVKLEHHFGTDLDFLISLSQTALRSDSGTGPKFSGNTYDTRLTYRISSRLQTMIEFSRQTNPSGRLDASYSIDQTLTAGVDYRLSTRMIARLGASDARHIYQGSNLVSGFDLTRETAKSFFTSLGYNITPNLSVSLTANQDQRHADVVDYSYTGTRFGLSISQAF